MTNPLVIVPECASDAPLADALIACAFGPGRFAKTAERLREGSRALAELSFVAWIADRAVGCVRLWPIAIGATPAILLGPIAVDDRARSAGVGAGLIRRACEAAAKEGHQVVLLVGDEAYFGQFGFSARAARDVSLPGPVDQNRVLAKALTSGAAEGLSGRVRAAATTPGRPELARTMSVAA